MTVVATPSVALPTSEERGLGTVSRIVIAGVGVAGLIAAVPEGVPVLWYVPYAGIAALLVIRRPRQAIGWILGGLGLAFVTVSLNVPASATDFAAGTLSPFALLVTILGWISGPLIFFLIGLLAIVFPSGRLPTGSWGTVARVGLTIGIIDLGLTLLLPTINVSLWASSLPTTVRNPIGLPSNLPIWEVVTQETVFLPVAALMAASVVSLFVRYRLADGVERQQLRWIAAALVLVVSTVVGGFVVGLLVPAAAQSGIVWIGAVVAFPTVPVAVGVAVQRYRLYEIDAIINRTLVYTLLTAVLAGTMSATVAITRQLFAGLIGASGDGSLIVSTLVVVSVFEPVKGRIQAFVDRRVKSSQDPAGVLVRYLDELHRSPSAPDPARALRLFNATAVSAYRASSGTLDWTGRDGQPMSSTELGNPRKTTGSGPDAVTASATARGYKATLSLTAVADRRSTDALEPALGRLLEELP